MTSDTIEDDRTGQRSIFFWLLLGSLLVHIVLLVVFGPWIRSQMEFDRQQGEARAEQVRQREQRRQAAEVQRREQMVLSSQQSRKLREDYEQRRRIGLTEHLFQLDQIAREMRRMRQEGLREIQNRSEQEIVLSRIKRLRRLADAATHRGENVKSYSNRVELKQHLDRQAVQRNAAVDKFAKEPSQYIRLAKELGTLAHEQYDEITHQQEIETQSGQAHRMKAVKESLMELASAAEGLAQGVELQWQNDVASVPAPLPHRTPPAAASSAELYRAAVEWEQMIQSDFNVVRGTELARSRGLAVPDTIPNTDVESPNRPDLSVALNDSASTTVGDVDRFRKALEQAGQEMADMHTRALGLLAQAKGDALASGQGGWSSPYATTGRGMVIAQAARGTSGHVIDMTGLLGGAAGGADNEGLREADFDSLIRDPVEAMQRIIGPELRVNPDDVQRNALPGREFSDDSNRQGWLFVDTWYVIGPWENQGQLQHERSHPPEQVIDFDAIYVDGKFADSPGHPYQELKWRFYQSDQIRCQPPAVFNDSTYYAYTELLSDRDRDVLLTISTDDAAKAWLNGQPVWEDIGLSPWSLGEGFRRIPLQKGYNSLLVRIENGPLHCVWSVLMCPTELLE